MNGDYLRMLPDHVLTTKVFTYFGFNEYAMTGCACKYSQAHWTEANQHNPMPLYVPEDYRTLQEAVERGARDPRITTIELGEGEHKIGKIDGGCYLMISCAVKIVGRPDVPKEKIVVLGSFWFKKRINGNCHLEHMTLRKAKKNGMYGRNGVIAHSSFTMKDVIVEQCMGSGVVATGTDVVGQCTNLEVRHCHGCGVFVDGGASMRLIGAKTTVHNNKCNMMSAQLYGLTVYSTSSSTIQLVSPLTKELVSIGNGGGGNYGGARGGDINQIKTIVAPAPALTISIETTPNSSTPRALLEKLPTFTQHQILAIFMQHQILAFFVYKDFALAGMTCRYFNKMWKKAIGKKRLPLYVPEDCGTLEEAVKRAEQDPRITTIVLGQGEHQIKCELRPSYCLKIYSVVNIVGRPNVPKEKILVLGGIWFKEGIQGNCHLQHLTLSQAKLTAQLSGVLGQSSFTMEDVLVEQCGGDGVCAVGTGVVGRCTNVEVRQCGQSGVSASNGASITLIGAKTSVHHNCTAYGSETCDWWEEYGLQVQGASSTIQLVSPLTKERVAIDNGGIDNWGVDGGDISQIKTIDAPVASFSSSSAAAAAAAAAAVGETKCNHESSQRKR